MIYSNLARYGTVLGQSLEAESPSLQETTQKLMNIRGPHLGGEHKQVLREDSNQVGGFVSR